MPAAPSQLSMTGCDSLAMRLGPSLTALHSSPLSHRWDRNLIACQRDFIFNHFQRLNGQFVSDYKHYPLTIADREWREVWFFVMCCSLIFTCFQILHLTYCGFYLRCQRFGICQTKWTDTQYVSVRIALIINMLILSTFTLFKFDILSIAYKNSCHNRSTLFCFYAHTCVAACVRSDDIQYCTWSVHLSLTKHVGKGPDRPLPTCDTQSYHSVCQCDAASFTSLPIVKTTKEYRIPYHMFIFLSQLCFAFTVLVRAIWMSGKYGCQVLDVFLNSQ